MIIFLFVCVSMLQNIPWTVKVILGKSSWIFQVDKLLELIWFNMAATASFKDAKLKCCGSSWEWSLTQPLSADRSCLTQICIPSSFYCLFPAVMSSCIRRQGLKIHVTKTISLVKKRKKKMKWSTGRKRRRKRPSLWTHSVLQLLSASRQSLSPFTSRFFCLSFNNLSVHQYSVHPSIIHQESREVLQLEVSPCFVSTDGFRAESSL